MTGGLGRDLGRQRPDDLLALRLGHRSRCQPRQIQLPPGPIPPCACAVPVTAIATRTPAVAYDPADTISSWTDVSTTIVPRAVGGWGCPVTEKNYTIFQGGCVPLVSAAQQRGGGGGEAQSAGQPEGSRSTAVQRPAASLLSRVAAFSAAHR